MIKKTLDEVCKRADKSYAENRDLYTQSQMIVEHVFGTVKRGLGFSYFLLRGNKMGAKEVTGYFKARVLLRFIHFAETKRSFFL